MISESFINGNGSQMTPSLMCFKLIWINVLLAYGFILMIFLTVKFMIKHWIDSGTKERIDHDNTQF